MKPYLFKITTRKESTEDVSLELNPSQLQGYGQGVIAGTGEWMRTLVLTARRESAPELFEELRTMPLDTEFVFARMPTKEG